MSNTFKTKAGTELPLMNLKGKDYLEVKYRLVWFREEKPNWSIETQLISANGENGETLFKAVISDENGKVKATAHKAESPASFRDGHHEKAESGAIGRALSFIGYGTQFCADELDEGERVVDSPVAPSPKPKAPYRDLAPVTPINGTDLGSYVIKMGKKFKGQRLDKIDIYELNGFGEWLSEKSDLDGIGKETLEKITAFLDSRDKQKAK